LTWGTLREGKNVKKNLLIWALLIGSAASVGAQTDPNRPYANGFAISSQPVGATVYLEGEIIGKTPCRFPHDITGNYRLMAEKIGYERWKMDVQFGNAPIDSINISLHPLRRSKAFVRSLVFTGWGQAYSQQPLKSRIFISAQMLAILAAGWSQWQYSEKQDKYELRTAEYLQKSKSFASEPAAWQQVVAAHDGLNKVFDLRQALIATAAVIYAYNLLDAVLFFPQHKREIEFVPFTQTWGYDGSTTTFGLVWNF